MAQHGPISQSLSIEVHMSNFVVPDQDPMDELRRWIAEATNVGISNSALYIITHKGSSSSSFSLYFASSVARLAINL